MLWTDGSVPFDKGGSGILANCSLCDIKATFSFSAGPVRSSFSAEACAIVQALCWPRQHQQVCHFSSPPIWLSFCPHHPVLSSIFPFTLIFLANLAGTVFSLLLFYQATMGPRTLVSTGEQRDWWAGQTGSATSPFCNPLQSLCYLSYPLFSFLGLEAYCLIKIFWHTGSLDFHRGTCAPSSRSLCSLSSSLQRTRPSVKLLSF